MPIAIRSTQYLDVDGTSDQFTNPMEPGYQYRFTCNQDCWLLIGATGATAAANTDGNILYTAGQVLLLANPDQIGTTNAFVHVIQDSALGDAVLAMMEPV